MSLGELEEGHTTTHVLKEWSHGGKLGIYDNTPCLVSLCLRPVGNLGEDRPAIHEDDVINVVVGKVMRDNLSTCVHFRALQWFPLFPGFE